MTNKMIIDDIEWLKKIAAFNAPYSKMTAIIVFFRFPSNYPLLPRS